jgi:predicted acylesterase/phospholipase RssA
MRWIGLLLTAFLVLAGCAGTNTRSIPEDFDFATAAPYGIPDVARFGADGDNIVASAGGPIIAFSGGGELGAFGAGIVTGWTQRGDRPEFSLVTGVSTGSIVALFTFLGPDYDETLSEIYSRYDTRDLLRSRILPAVFGAPAINDADRYRRLLDRYIDETVLRRLAEEGAKGRKLIVVSTDLDRETAVHWDMTAIAQSGHPDALTLLRDVIQASSAIPVVFPPVLIPFRDDKGREYAAMQVDGGVTLQFTTMGLATRRAQRSGATEVYVVLNQFVEPEASAKAPHVLAVASATTSTMIESAVLSEADRAAVAARAAGIRLRFAAIPSDFTRPPADQEFDPTYMSALQAEGRRLILGGRLWQPTPVGPS